MALSGSRLGTAISTDILTALNSAFPTNSSLLPAEKTLINNAKAAFAAAIGNPSGSDIATEITTNANVSGTVTSGSGAGGTVVGTVL